jgi:dihydropyrimidinase
MAIRGGTVVTAERAEALDVLIRGGAILDLVAPGTPADSGTAVDARGQLVVPGLVDPHCHFNTFSHHVDDLSSLSAAALAGGVTTMIPFLIPGGAPGQPESLVAVLDHFVDEGRKLSVIDFGFHVALWPRWEAVEEIEACIEHGCSSFKMFLALPRLGRMVPDDLIVAFMERIGDVGGISMVHAENGLVTDYLEARMRERGKTAPTFFAESRPAVLEEEATFRAICLSRVARVPLYIVHVTCEAAARRIAEARGQGLQVIGETCPQYLTLDDGVMETQGSLAKVAPPLRTAADRAFLWRALSRGDISTIGSDHSAHARETKEQGRSDVFEGIPFGAATVETMLPLLVSEGIVEGRMTPERMVEVTSANPAKLFGLYPQKGTIAAGSDADIVLIDTDGTVRIEASRLHDRSGYSLYEGWHLRGAVQTVIAGGTIAARDGELLEAGRRGRFLPRASSAVPEGLV